MSVRQPIITVCGHIDAGKTTLLDSIRGGSVAAGEAGGITQHISATEIPASTIKTGASDLIKAMKLDVKLPGLLFIDTPGHEAFNAVRKRGGSIADMAVLVVDINHGFQPQTFEVLDILKNYKTPFIIAANKVDRLPGWHSVDTLSISKSISEQDESTKILLDQKVYELVGTLHEQGFESELYSRVEDMTKQITIIPMSAHTKEGIAELLMYLTGISQKFLEKTLETEVSGPGKGSILEIKDEQGFGKTLDVILYDGIMRTGDTIVVGGVNGPFETKIRAILKPKPLKESRSSTEHFDKVDSVSAAAGIKISAPGSPVYVADDVDMMLKQVETEIGEVAIDTDSVGVVIKADTLGSLEAIIKLLRDKNFKIRSASVGTVKKADINEAVSVRSADRYSGVVFAFNVNVEDSASEVAKDNNVPIFKGKVVYSLLDKYEEWVEKEKYTVKTEGMKGLVLPGKIKILPGHIFRKAKPVVVGIKVIAGKIQADFPLMKEDGTFIGRIKTLQVDGKSVPVLKQGEEAAISIKEPIVVGRHLFEEDVLLTQVPRTHYVKLKKEFDEFLGDDEKELLEEIREINVKFGV